MSLTAIAVGAATVSPRVLATGQADRRFPLTLPSLWPPEPPSKAFRNCTRSDKSPIPRPLAIPFVSSPRPVFLERFSEFLGEHISGKQLLSRHKSPVF